MAALLNCVLHADRLGAYVGLLACSPGFNEDQDAMNMLPPVASDLVKSEFCRDGPTLIAVVH